MSRILVVLAAVLLAVPATVGVPLAAAQGVAAQGVAAQGVAAQGDAPAYAPVAQISPTGKDDDDGDDGEHGRRSSKEHRGEHAEDIDLSKLSDEELATLGVVAEVLVIAAVASLI